MPGVGPAGEGSRKKLPTGRGTKRMLAYRHSNHPRWRNVEVQRGSWKTSATRDPVPLYFRLPCVRQGFKYFREKRGVKKNAKSREPEKKEGKKSNGLFWNRRQSKRRDHDNEKNTKGVEKEILS